MAGRQLLPFGQSGRRYRGDPRTGTDPARRWRCPALPRRMPGFGGTSAIDPDPGARPRRAVRAGRERAERGRRGASQAARTRCRSSRRCTPSSARRGGFDPAILRRATTPFEPTRARRSSAAARGVGRTEPAVGHCRGRAGAGVEARGASADDRPAGDLEMVTGARRRVRARACAGAAGARAGSPRPRRSLRRRSTPIRSNGARPSRLRLREGRARRRPSWSGTS